MGTNHQNIISLSIISLSLKRRPKCNTYWSAIVNYGFSDHASYSFVTAVAPMGTWSHDPSALSTILFKYSQTSRHVQLAITTAASVLSLHHH